MRVQSTPKISRFLALPGSLSLFTAHAIIPPIIPKKSGNKYQAPLTCSTGFIKRHPGRDPSNWCTAIWTYSSWLGYLSAAALAKHGETTRSFLVGFGFWLYGVYRRPGTLAKVSWLKCMNPVFLGQTVRFAINKCVGR